MFYYPLPEVLISMDKPQKIKKGPFFRNTFVYNKAIRQALSGVLLSENSSNAVMLECIVYKKGGFNGGAN